MEKSEMNLGGSTLRSLLKQLSQAAKAEEAKESEVLAYINKQIKETSMELKTSSLSEEYLKGHNTMMAIAKQKFQELWFIITHTPKSDT